MDLNIAINFYDIVIYSQELPRRRYSEIRTPLAVNVARRLFFFFFFRPSAITRAVPIKIICLSKRHSLHLPLFSLFFLSYV